MTPHDSPARPSRATWAWAMYDFANSGYTTVVLTAVYNAYFVGVVAGHLGIGRATLLWTLSLGLSNALVILSAPIIGTLADAWAAKKPFLALSTGVCVVATALLGLIESLPLAVGLLVVSNLAFATGENLISAFLPEIAPEGKIGRVSAFGWSLGYLGGLTVLGLCLGAIAALGPRAEELGVPITMGIVALCYGLAALPTFLWVPERSRPHKIDRRMAFGRLKRTFVDLGRFPDLRSYLATAFAMACGTFTVIVMAAVYAREVFGFGTPETLGLIVALNLAAAAGALGFGQLQDRWGSVPALGASLALWVGSLGMAYAAQGRTSFWVAALGVGIALGGSQSMGRALLGILAPEGRFGEFYGFWGMTLRLAAIVGPASYGAIAASSGGNLRLGLLSTAAYFLTGALLLLRIDEKRGREQAARMASPQDETR